MTKIFAQDVPRLLVMLKLGSHVKFSKGNKYLFGSASEAKSYGANAMMIYLGAPQNSRRVPFEEYCYQDYCDSDLFKDIPPENIVVHAPYIINPAKIEKQEFAKDFLLKEAQNAERIGSLNIVLHPGSKGNYDLNTALQSCADVVRYVLKNTTKINIAIETMSAKGTEIGVSFEEIKKLLDLINHPRARVCLDTCHIWDAGYDVCDFDKVLNDFDRIIGLKKLTVIHLNDSKNPLNSKKDRHANIGEGYIGLEALVKITHHPLLDNIPIILETPYVNDKPIYKKEIQMLKGAK